MLTMRRTKRRREIDENGVKSPQLKVCYCQLDVMPAWNLDIPEVEEFNCQKYENSSKIHFIKYDHIALTIVDLIHCCNY